MDGNGRGSEPAHWKAAPDIHGRKKARLRAPVSTLDSHGDSKVKVKAARTYRRRIARGPRPFARGAPSERHFGFSGHAELQAANDNGVPFARRLYTMGPLFASLGAVVGFIIAKLI